MRSCWLRFLHQPQERFRIDPCQWRPGDTSGRCGPRIPWFLTRIDPKEKWPSSGFKVHLSHIRRLSSRLQSASQRARYFVKRHVSGDTQVRISPILLGCWRTCGVCSDRDPADSSASGATCRVLDRGFASRISTNTQCCPFSPSPYLSLGAAFKPDGAGSVSPLIVRLAS